MSRAETLEFLGTVIDNLEPIGQMTPGTPLRAADWNAMVEAVRNLARLVSSRERTTDSLLDERYARIDHDHSGKIALSWFEPATRALVEEGLNGAVEQRTQLKRVQEDLTALRREVAALRDQINAVRADLDGLRDSDAARNRQVTDVALRVEGVRDVEKKMSDLSTRFDGVSADVSEALAFRDQLVDDAGAPIDIGSFANRLGQLEGMREQLRTADGEIVRIREVESAIARLEENAINRNEVDDVILQRLRQGNILDETGLEAAVAGRVEGRFTDQFDAITARTTQMETDLTGVKQQVNTGASRVAGLENRMAANEGAVNGLPAMAARVDANAVSVANLQGRVNAITDSVGDLPAVRSRLSQVENAVTQIGAVDDRVGLLDGRLGGLEGQMAQLPTIQASLAGLDSRLQGLDQRTVDMAAIRQGVSANTSALGKLGQRMDANEAQLDNLAAVPGQLTALTKRTDELSGWRVQVDTRLDDLSRRTVATDALVTRVDNMERIVGDNTANLNTLSVKVKEHDRSVAKVDAIDARTLDLDRRLVGVERQRLTRL